MRPQRFAVILRVAALALLLSGAPAMAGELEQVLARFDEVQASIRTFSATFTEETENVLLAKPITAKGLLYMTKPDSVRWEYSSPEVMRFVISDDKYTGYFPAQQRAEKRDIRRWREQLFRFLGLGQASSELSEFYDISLADDENAREGTHLLILDPKKKRVRKRMDAVRFWIDDQTFQPTRVEYHSKNGNRRAIEFSAVSINPELAANLYSVELPPDVKVSDGFSALAGFSATTR